MAKTPLSCLFLSEPWCVVGSFLGLKGLAKVFSVEEESDVPWKDLLLHNRVYQHTCSSYDQGKFNISHTLQARVWKCHRCRRYSTQCTDTIPNASLFRKAPLAYFQSRLPQQWWETNQWAASCSLSPGSLHGFSITPKALQTCLLWGELWGGKRNPSFWYQGKVAQS